MKEKLPYVKWFFSDWMRDTRGLSLEARGAWMDILSLMHDGEPYGHLAVNGKPRPIENLARIIGTSTKTLQSLLLEMEDNGLFSRTSEGVVFCRRMVKESYLRQVRGEGGKKGGNPNLTGKAKVDEKVNLSANLNSDDKVGVKVDEKVNLSANLSVDTTMEVLPESRDQSLEKEQNPPTVPLWRNQVTPKSKKPPEQRYAPEFERFWSAFPRKVNKGTAYKAWQKEKPPLDECLKTLDWQTKTLEWTREQGQFIPHPSTWLNARGWENQPLQPVFTPRRTSDLAY